MSGGRQSGKQYARHRDGDVSHGSSQKDHRWFFRFIFLAMIPAR
jgi:hypothetical protein